MNVEDLLLHAGWLRRFAVALVTDPDAAEDLAQDTQVAAWLHPGRRSGRPWLARVARNLAIDRWRSDDRRQRREEAVTATTAEVRTPEQLVGDRQIHRAVADAVTALDEPFRQTVVLRFYDGMSSAEIARALAVPEGTVRWRLKEGIERVRRDLDQRHGQVRASWVAALLPLLPSGAAELARAPDVPPGSRPEEPRPAFHPITLAGITILVAGMALMIVGVARRHGLASSRAPSTAPPPIPAVTEPRGAEPLPRIRLDLASLATPDEPEPRPGPGDADATSLFRELLEAIKAGAYDDYVAKGSAGFKANARSEVFQKAVTAMGPLLAQGYQPTLLGQLRRHDWKVWVFRVELASGADDALAFMTTDGWQIAGLYFPNPEP